MKNYFFFMVMFLGQNTGCVAPFQLSTELLKRFEINLYISEVGVQGV